MICYSAAVSQLNLHAGLEEMNEQYMKAVQKIRGLCICLPSISLHFMESFLTSLALCVINSGVSCR